MKITSRSGREQKRRREGGEKRRRKGEEGGEKEGRKGRVYFISFGECWLIKHALSTHSDLGHDDVIFCSCALLICMYLFIIFSPLEKNFMNKSEETITLVNSRSFSRLEPQNASAPPP